MTLWRYNMGKRNYELRVSSIESFWPNGKPKSKTKYDSHEKEAYTINYDEQGRPLNGVCGDFMNWEMIDCSTIKITGDGDMDDFSTRVLPPWHEHEITSVIVGEGVESIGKYAFSAVITNAHINNVELPESLCYVPSSAVEGNSF